MVPVETAPRVVAMDDKSPSMQPFLSRWSRRKIEARKAAPVVPAVAPTERQIQSDAETVNEPAVRAEPAIAIDTQAQPVRSPLMQTDGTSGTAVNPASDPPATLPPLETLDFDSDYTRFLAPDVDETVKRGALKKLFADPRFNVMDGLDVYVDDYSLPDPMPEGMLAQLVHARAVLNPVRTEISAAGHAVDVLPAEPDGVGDATVAVIDAQSPLPAPPIHGGTLEALQPSNTIEALKADNEPAVDAGRDEVASVLDAGDGHLESGRALT